MNRSIYKYNDIIDMTHHISKKHKPMPMEARAAQFAPFAALTGYSDKIRETARYTDERIEIDDELKMELSKKLKFIKDKILMKPEVTFMYFIPDMVKQGGTYVSITGKVEKIDQNKQIIILKDTTKIPISEIIEISSDIFKNE